MSPEPALSGLLVIDKPEGPTSHDVVARMRRTLGQRRIGHTGTLDPLATGVLALLLGPATRLAQFLSADDKRYVAAIRLGVATRTYDREGEPVGPPGSTEGVDRAAVDAALDAFRGEFLQTPPIYSAKKVGGVSAHRLARRGDAAALEPVRVSTRAIEILAMAGPDLTLDVACSAGFYVRSLAHDLGTALGCGAHLRALRRTAAGDIGLAQALTLAEAEASPDRARAHIQPLGALLPAWPAVRVTARGEARVRTGSLVSETECETWTEPPAAPAEGAGAVTVRILDPAGNLMALGAWTGRGGAALLHPRVVLV